MGYNISQYSQLGKPVYTSNSQKTFDGGRTLGDLIFKAQQLGQAQNMSVGTVALTSKYKGFGKKIVSVTYVYDKIYIKDSFFLVWS